MYSLCHICGRMRGIMGIFGKGKKTTEEEQKELINQTQNQSAEEKKTEKAGGSMAAGYQFAADVKLKECRYCRVMIPKAAKICPNCKKRVKKRWLRNLIILLLLIALCLAGAYYYFYVYQKEAATVSSVAEVTETAEKTDAVEEIDAVEGTRTDKPQTGKTDDASTERDAAYGVETAKQDGAEPEKEVEIPALIAEPMEQEAEETDNKAAAGMKQTEGKLVNIIEPEVTGEDICGADGPILDYADEQTIIFHDYYGLFVYDMEAGAMAAAIDLEPIGCQYTQGDSYCEVTVEEDGGKVYLHPVNTKDMYVYEVEEAVLTSQKYAAQSTEKIYEPEQTKEHIKPDTTVFRSESCADLGRNSYLYLESGSGMAADLCYVIEQKGKRIASESLFEDYLLTDEKSTDEENTDEMEMDKAEKMNEKDEKEEEDADTGMDAEADVEAEVVDVSAYTEAEFKNICQQVNYKALLRQQDIYLNTGITVELTVLKQIDGGLFDENIYYLCAAEDKEGIERYYIVRDDRVDDTWLILEGDVLLIYGQLFGSCRLPAELEATQPIVPALTMVYYELLDE